MQELADSFIEGQLAISDYVDQYVKKRTTAHLQKAKAEKMADILRERQHNTSFHGYNAAAPRGPAPNTWGEPSGGAPVTNNWGASAAPYPTGQFGMPDPMAYMPR